MFILKLLQGASRPKFLTGTSPQVLWGERAVALPFRTKEAAILAADRLRSHGTIGVEFRTEDHEGARGGAGLNIRR